MSNLQARVIKAAHRAAARVQGGRIVYRRGEDDGAPIEATFGQSEFAVETADSVLIEHSDRDFIFPAECLVLGGTLATPKKGDRITIVEEEHLDKQVFEVLPADGKKCYRLCDSHGHLIRVYTKRVQ